MQPQDPEPQAHLSDLAVSDRGFVFDPYTGMTYTLNPVGLCILRGLKASSDLPAIVSALREGFEVPERADLERDVLEFVALMRAQGLLPKDFEL